MNCDRCGEPLGDEPRAELWNPQQAAEWEAEQGEPMPHHIVHAEPCAEEMLRAGWEIA